MNATAVFYGPSARAESCPNKYAKIFADIFSDWGGAIKRVWVIAVESIIMLFVCHLCRCLSQFMLACEGVFVCVSVESTKLFTHCQTAALAAHLS